LCARFDDYRNHVCPSHSAEQNVSCAHRYNFGNFEVIPTEPFSVVTASLLKPTTTSLSGNATSLLIGTYNVLNLDPNDNDGDTDVADGRFKANAEIIAVHMNRPDVVALQEIQDNSGSANDGVVSAEETLAALVAAISDIDPNLKYKFIDNTFIGDNTSGGEPGANIRTAYLYNPARISVDMTSLESVVDPTEQQTNSTNPFYGSRLPLAATFTFLPTGFVFEMINNHWSAKGGSAPAVGLVQPFEELQEDPNVNGSLEKRQAQSAAILAYVSGKDNVIVLGDLNEFEFVSPVASLGDKMTLLTETIDEDERYSYMFQGNSQALDHILVSVGIDAVAEYVHVNSEFADGPSKASDHDPMVALIQVPTMVESSPTAGGSSSSSPKPPTPPAVAASPTKSAAAAPPTETPPTDGSFSFSSGRRRNDDHLCFTTTVVAVAGAIVLSAGMVL
jgi:predicted extracellular nuclease